MPKTPHPRVQFLGWGWFKNSRLKAPGSPATSLSQPGTAGRAPLQHFALPWLVTASNKQCCH
eukprot:6465983-Amphidinium_carterae.1